MRWGRRWPDYEPRPKVQRLSKERKERLLKTFSNGIESSPVLSELGFRARALRGRFYVERLWEDDGESELEVVARITPLAGSKQTMLLETQNRSGNWHEVERGSTKKVIQALTDDSAGTFHGLGDIDKALRKAGGGSKRPKVRMTDDLRFVYVGTRKECSAQESLYHFFGLPLEVIAEPAEWYAYHRTPKIVEVNDDRTRVLVRFASTSFTGRSFGGTCLYAKVDGEWGAYTIKPNQSQDIASAEAWLDGRGWEDW